MKATHIIYENKTNNQIANLVLKALNRLSDINNGSISNSFEYASYVLDDKRTLIQTVAEDGFIRYNDGYLIVEADDYCLYVDYTSKALVEYNYPKNYKIHQNFKSN